MVILKLFMGIFIEQMEKNSEKPDLYMHILYYSFFNTDPSYTVRPRKNLIESGSDLSDSR